MKRFTGGTKGENMSGICGSVEKIEDLLNEITYDSTKMGKELGITWCILPQHEVPHADKTEPYISATDRDIGNESDIAIGSDRSVTYNITPCQPTELKGSFHTHVCSPAIFSLGDYYAMFELVDSISCVGRTYVGDYDKPNGIVCDVIDIDNEHYEDISQRIETICKEVRRGYG